MILADSGYPLLNLMWTMCIFFGWILWFWLLIAVYTDLFRRKDIGGGAKTLWVLFTLVLPFLGALTYLITQGRSMAERGEQRAREQRAAMDDYVRSVAASGNGAASNGNGAGHQSPADQLVAAKNLLDSGGITPTEYEDLKRKVLA